MDSIDDELSVAIVTKRKERLERLHDNGVSRAPFALNSTGAHFFINRSVFAITKYSARVCLGSIGRRYPLRTF